MKYTKFIVFVLILLSIIFLYVLYYKKYYIYNINKNILKNSKNTYNLLDFNKDYSINYIMYDYLEKNNIKEFNFNFDVSEIKIYEKYKYGIAINKSNLRFLPTNKIYYKTDKNFDLLQNSEIKFNELVIILFEYKNWYFVQTYNTNGWVEKNNIAFFETKNDFKKYLNNNKFVVVIDKNIIIDNIFIDMGVKINYVSEKDGFYILQFPIVSKNNLLDFKYIKIYKNGLNKGYLKYNKKNLLNQTYKYLNTKYSWGGKDFGIDCSGFVLNVFSTFGIKLPRNSIDQQKSTGKFLEISKNFTIQDRIKLLKSIKIGSLIYFKGHIMIYIGFINQKPYIIHALASSLNINPLSVVITDLNIKRKNQKTFLEAIESITLF